MELLKPFANTGEKEVFDEDTSPSGNMSLEKGFTQLFELKPEEGGLFILRKKFNQLMYLMSKANVEFNAQSFPNWIEDKGDGSPYAYNKGVIVTYKDNMQYVSLINNNTEEPTTGSNWKLADLNNYMDLLTNQDVDGIKRFTSFPITPSLAPSTNYQVANKKYVDDNAGNEIATAAEIRTGTNNTKAISPLGYNQTTLGWGQTWQDVAASRSAGVTYTNTTGKPIIVSLRCSSGITSITINGIIIGSWNSSAGGTEFPVYFIVGNGETYSSSRKDGYWYEYR